MTIDEALRVIIERSRQIQRDKDLALESVRRAEARLETHRALYHTATDRMGLLKQWAGELCTGQRYDSDKDAIVTSSADESIARLIGALQEWDSE